MLNNTKETADNDERTQILQVYFDPPRPDLLEQKEKDAIKNEFALFRYGLIAPVITDTYEVFGGE